MTTREILVGDEARALASRVRELLPPRSDDAFWEEALRDGLVGWFNDLMFDIRRDEDETEGAWLPQAVTNPRPLAVSLSDEDWGELDTLRARRPDMPEVSFWQLILVGGWKGNADAFNQDDANESVVTMREILCGDGVRAALAKLREREWDASEASFWQVVLGEGIGLYGHEVGMRGGSQIEKLPTNPRPLSIPILPDTLAEVEALRARRPEMAEAVFWHHLLCDGTDLLGQRFDHEDNPNSPPEPEDGSDGIPF